MRLARGSSRYRWLAVLGAVVLALALVSALGVFLLLQQRTVTGRLYDDLDERSAIAAGSIGGVITVSEANHRAIADDVLSGPTAGLPAAIKGQAAGVLGVAVLDAGGTVLAADPISFRSSAAAIGKTRALAGLRPGDPLRFGDLVSGTGLDAIPAILPYAVNGSLRALIVAFPVSSVENVSLAALTNSLGAVQGDAYVIDDRGTVIVSTEVGAAGRAPADSGLTAALRRTGSGFSGGSYYTATPIRSSSWTLVLVADKAALMAPVRATSHVAWLLFSAFAAAMVLLLVIGAVAVRNARRLAHARRYDALTGLRNRALFFEDVQATLDKREPAAVLFIDLDGFKPVNDSYGHATGDALLAEVAVRLTAAVRARDVVGRFGGDEFVVLCPGPGEQHEFAAVADRIQHAIQSPFVIEGRPITVGASIGIALPVPGIESAEALIHRADLAMYDAKDAGRGLTKIYAPA
jgi:diguanylate cyclase (GGDEF)-like protein